MHTGLYTLGRDKVHPPCTRLVPFIPPAAPSRPQPSWTGCAHRAPRSSRSDLPPGRCRRPGSVGVIPRSSAAHSTGQSVGVCGVFPPPCQRARGASFTSQPPPPLTVRPLRGCVSKAFREHGALALVSRPLPHGFGLVLCGGFGVVVGVSLAPLVRPFQSHAGELG